MKKIIFTLSCIFITGFVYAHVHRIVKINGIPSDTSYTLHSTAVKIYKHYPQAKLASIAVPEGVSVDKNITYETIGKRKLVVDVFYPTGLKTQSYPGVLLIHGGGWISGERNMTYAMAEQLALKGFISVCVEYRLGPEALYPAGVYDLKTAVRWMRAKAPKYHIDTNKIAAYGCSAGAELASFLGTTGNLKQFNKIGKYLNHSSAVEAVVNVDGLLDFTNVNSTKYDENPQKPSAAHRWFGSSYKNRPDIWTEASPLTYVNRKSPPIIFINSAQPHYHAGRDDMIKLLKKYHIYYEQYTLKGTHHTFWLFHPWFDTTLDYTVNFLNNVFK